MVCDLGDLSTVFLLCC